MKQSKQVFWMDPKCGFSERPGVIFTLKIEELNAWKAFSDGVKNFLGNIKSPNFSKFVESLLQVFHNLRCNMGVKVHFLQSHIFPEKVGAFSEEYGERFHQDIKLIKIRYQRK